MLKAINAARDNDVVYQEMRKKINDYVVRDSDTARDLRLVQMDSRVDDLVKSTNALDEALKDPTFTPPYNTSPSDAIAIRNAKTSLAGVLIAQKIQLDVLSGFVSTERDRRYGTLDESQRQMAGTVGPTKAELDEYSSKGFATPQPMNGFLNDEHDVFAQLKHPAPEGLIGAQRLDRDFGDIATYTAAREAVATKEITQAANLCNSQMNPTPSTTATPKP